ncbi:MAG: hydroxymethylbilane synthase [Syntrophobacteraceae bacterium]|nr:hydroxymethylbilane synthase [Syntrophobacteraceae bacterium]
MTREIVRIATRGSMLALRQSGMMKAALEKLWPHIGFELLTIKTTGDKIVGVPLAKVGGKGLFVKEIEDALLDGSADLAVHSMKDVPAVLPDGLRIAALPEREDPRDALILREGGSIGELRERAVIGTSSLRRAAQMRAVRSDFEIRDLRGNLDTRLRKLDEGLFDAIILAAAGLNRLGWQSRATVLMDPVEFIPAVGQGALAIEARSEDLEILRLLEPLDHFETAVAVRAERSLLRELEGGCQVPIGGYARVAGKVVELFGLVASLDGRQLFKVARSAPLEEAELLGKRVAAELLGLGAKQVLDEIYGSAPMGPNGV